MLTHNDAVVLTAYTGYMLVDDFSDVHAFIENLIGHPVFTHELINEEIKAQIQEKAKPYLEFICGKRHIWPEPMKQEDVEQLYGEKIQIRYIGGCENFYDDEVAPYYGKYEKYIRDEGGMLAQIHLPLSHYGKEWLAYKCH